MQQITNPTSEPAAANEADAASFPAIPGYRFRKRLGQGGMATVYLATQESLDRPVSIKVMARDGLRDETSMQRFENEARTIAKLGHSGIVGIHEVGRTSDGQMYYVMPYLPNGDLAQRDLRNDEPQIVEVLRALLTALGYAHSHGIVHRDVKEENVLFDAHNRPQLTDFGIARSKADTSRLTRDGLSVGSSAFMAPEQARGEEVDGRADLYSVGVLTYALLTGHLPFRATDPLAVAIMHAQDPVPRLPPEKSHWQGFIDRAMAKSPANRYANAALMLQALDAVQRRADSTLATRIRESFATAIGRVGGNRQLALLALAGALLLVTGLFVLTTWFGSTDAPVAAATAVAPVSEAAAPAPSIKVSDADAAATLPASAATIADADAAEPAPAVASSTAAATTSEPGSHHATAPTATKPASKPASKPPASTKPQPVKKIKGFFSRLFRRR